jgi:hypothetical protein
LEGLPASKEKETMARLAEVQGQLVAMVERPYRPFTDRATGETRPGGVSYLVYVVEDFGSEPTEVRVREAADWQALRSVKPGSNVRLACDQFAQNNRIRLTLAPGAIEAAA